MKRLLLCAGFLSIFNSIEAKPVSPQSALSVAQNFLNSKTSSRIQSLQLIKSYGDAQALVYVFRSSGQPGFVIISGDDLVTPVLGYSLESHFPTSEISPEVNNWLEGYAHQIQSVVKMNLPPSNEVAQKWINLTTGLNSESGNKPTGVSPMLSTKWNQLPYYNIFCPSVPSGTPSSTPNAPAGCVATAMAQIMKFWDYPTTGTGARTYSSSTLGGTLSVNFGNTSYDWTNMPVSLNQNSSTVEKEAIATLMYHCGVAVKMDYKPQASGAYVISYGNQNRACSENALKNNFGYKSSIKGYPRSDFYDSTWIKLLKFEIDNGRPLLYTGYGQLGGHAFVFDGYDNNDFFHINWGWGGMSDGYFIVDNLSPSALGAGGGSGNFNTGQEALIMIEPVSSLLPPNPYTPDFVPEDFDLLMTADPISSADTIHFGSPYTLTAEIKNVGNEPFSNQNTLLIMALIPGSPNASLIDDVNTMILPDSTFTYSFSTQNMNLLSPGTYTLAFIYFDAQQNGDIIDNPNGGNAVTLTVLPATTSIENLLAKEEISVFPNPAKDQVYIQLKDNQNFIENITVTDIQGRVILKNEGLHQTELRLNTSSISAGFYLLHVQTNKGRVVEKITIQ